jgi:hypothetical protein
VLNHIKEEVLSVLTNVTLPLQEMKSEEISRAARILVRHSLPVHQRPRKVNAKRMKKKTTKQCKQLSHGREKKMNPEEI